MKHGKSLNLHKYKYMTHKTTKIIITKDNVKGQEFLKKMADLKKEQKEKLQKKLTELIEKYKSGELKLPD